MLCLYILIVLFCFNWLFKEIFTAFAYRPLLIFLGAMVFLAIFEKPAARIWNRLNEISVRWWIAICALFSFCICTYFAYGPLESIPHAFDDVCYIWMARAYTMGRLWVESHDLPEFFQQVFFINDGKWYPQFQPGWPALLALGAFVGQEYLVNPILTAVAVVLSYYIGRHIFDERIARLAMAMMAVSQMLLYFGGLAFTHPLSLVLTEIAILTTLRLSEKDTIPDALLLGLALGWLFITRALNMVSLLPVVVVPLMVLLLRGRVRFSRLVSGALVALVFLGLQFGYNHVLTGDATVWPQERYFKLTEAEPRCHDLGFGKHIGCENLHGPEGFPNGFYPSDAVDVFHHRMGQFLLTLFGWQAMFFFVGVPFFTSRYGWKKYLLLAVFLTLIGGYFFFYFHGARGRYYIESCFAVFLLVAAGMKLISEWLEPVSRKAEAVHSPYGALIRAFVPAMGMAYFVFNLAFFIPSTDGMLQNFYGVDRRYDRMTADLPEKSIIFVRYDYQAAFLYLSPGLPETHLFVLDLGKQNRQMMQYYPDWHFYTYNYDTKKLEKLEPDTDPSTVFVEAEYKFLSGDWSGEYLHPEVFIAGDGAKPSGEMVLSFDASGAGSFAAFEQYVFKDGNYDLDINFVTGPNRGRYELSIDGKVCADTVDLYSTTPGFLLWRPEACLPLNLNKGKHRFAFRTLGRNPASNSFSLGIDWMQLQLRQP